MIVGSIKQLLIDGKLKPGDILPPETELCEQLKTSRGSVREAMKILDAYGVIQIRRGEGTHISNNVTENMFMPLLFQLLVKQRDMAELIEVRQMLELGILELVVEHADQEEINRIIEAGEAFENALTASLDDISPYVFNLDIEFHRTISSCCHNQLVHGIYGFVIELFRSSIYPGSLGVLEAHKGILKGIVERDISLAKKHLRNHTAAWISANTDKLNGNRKKVHSL